MQFYLNYDIHCIYPRTPHFLQFPAPSENPTVEPDIPPLKSQCSLCIYQFLPFSEKLRLNSLTFNFFTIFRLKVESEGQKSEVVFCILLQTSFTVNRIQRLSMSFCFSN